MRDAVPPRINGAREILPTNLKPTHYFLLFEPDFENAVEFVGSVVINIDVLEEASSVSLHASNDMKILKTTVTSDRKKIGIVGTTYDTPKEILTLHLASTMKKGSKIVLKIEFKGSHLNHSHGFYRSPFKGPKGEDKWMFATQFEPTNARKAFPCFDEPSLKATFTVSLIAPKEKSCYGNMDIALEASVGATKKLTLFNKTPLMSTYIVCFAAGDLQYIQTNSFRIPIRVIATPDKNIEHGRRALELAARTLDTFEKIFDVPFPLPKMDLISISNSQGAMENWGLVTCTEIALLVDEEKSSANAWRGAARVIVHELAHQWFGNIVTMDFWEGLWLNEGFADWATCYAFETLEPSWQMWRNFMVGEIQIALALDSSSASHPIEVPVNNPAEINQIFDAISYNKGCAVIKMLSSLLGIEIFMEGVQHYLKKHSYGNANTADLWKSLSDVSGIDVGSIMETWTKEVGYPVVDVTEDESTGTVTLIQHRFFQDGSLDSKDDKTLYPVSLGLLTEEGLGSELTLYTRTKMTEVPLEFYKLNARQTGFYRVSYPPTRLQMLGQSAKAGLLSVEDKIGLISDALAMATSGHRQAKTSAVLDLLKAFEDDTDYFVWRQVFTALSAIKGAWRFEDQIASLQDFQTQLMRKILRERGWEFSITDENLDALFRTLLFSNAIQTPKVKKAAKAMFDKFIAGDAEAIHVNIQKAVFASVLEDGGTREYNAVLAASEKSASVDQRAICLGSLGYAQDPELIARTLDLLLKPATIVYNDMATLIPALTTHIAGTEALWSWIKGNYAAMRHALGDGLGTFARIMELATASLATKEQQEDVENFFAGKDTEYFDLYLAQAINRIQIKAKWAERDGDDVKEWLEVNGYA